MAKRLASAGKRRYKKYLGPDKDPDEEEPRNSKWRRRRQASTKNVAEEEAAAASFPSSCAGPSALSSQEPCLLNELLSTGMQGPACGADLTVMNASVLCRSVPASLRACAVFEETASHSVNASSRALDLCSPQLRFTLEVQDSRKSSTSDERLAERVPVLEVLDATVARKSVSSLMHNVPCGSPASQNSSRDDASLPGLSEQDEMELQLGEQPSGEEDEPLSNGSSSEADENQLQDHEPAGDQGEQQEGEHHQGHHEPAADQEQQQQQGEEHQDHHEPAADQDQQQQQGEEHQGHHEPAGDQAGQQPPGGDDQLQGFEDHAPNQGQQPPGPGGVDPGQNFHQNHSHPKLHRKMEGDFGPVIDTNVNASRNDALYMALGLARRENFSNSTFCNAINLVNNLFQSPILPTTIDSLDGILLSNQFVKYFFFCKNCMKLFGELDRKTVKRHLCPNPDCGVVNDISDLRKAQFFVMFSIPHQLQNLFQNPEICNSLLSPAEAVARGREHFISDLWQGSMYREFTAAVANFLCRVLSFHFSVDGSPLAVSSLGSIWPILLALNELPPKLRMTNLLLAGLWFGVKQAKMDLFLGPFVDQFRVLSQGFNIKIGNAVENCRAFCIGSCVDSGARGHVQGIKTHSGYNSCNWCIIRGLWIGHSVHFPLTEVESRARTHQEIDATQRQLVENPLLLQELLDEEDEPDQDPGLPENQRDLLGVKSVSPLINLPQLINVQGAVIPSFDMVKSFFVDAMHMLDLGISKFFLTRWMEDYGHGYYIKGAENEINARIKALQPPLEFRKLPRLLSERARYSARELRNWMMFSSVPVLTGILRSKFLKVWLHLVQAFYLLNLSEVSNEHANIADSLIKYFMRKTQEYYHQGNMTFNLHILLHLVAHVLRHGPPWASSAYCFEDGIGRLKRLIHSNQGIPHQIIRALSWAEAMKVLEGVVSDKAKLYVSRITQPEQHRQRSVAVGHARLIGQPEMFELSVEERYQCEQFGHHEENLQCYPKVIYKNCAFTDNKDRSIRYNNAMAQLNDKSLVLIRRIFFDSMENEVFLLVSNVHFDTILNPPAGVRIHRDDHFMRKVTHINAEIRYIKCDSLKIVCFRATLASGDFVAPFPNIYERQ